MPNFTITTDNSTDSHTTREGMDFPDAKAATDDAQVALGEMVGEKLPNGKHTDVGVQVEDASGKQVYRATINFDATSEAEIEREDDEADAAADEVASHFQPRAR